MEIELTTLDRGPSTARNVTFYFRKEFNVTTAQLNALEGDDPFYQILLGLQRDDGAVVYINGKELYRDNMPAGEIKWSTLATSSAGGTSETKFFESSPEGTGTLVSGKNVVAVEVHQSSPGSSDAGFNMSMSALMLHPVMVYLFHLKRLPLKMQVRDQHSLRRALILTMTLVGLVVTEMALVVDL